MENVISTKRRRRYFDRSGRIVLLFMALPCILFLFAFNYVPIFGWIYAFFKYQVGTPLFQSQFVGFANFTKIFTGNNVEIVSVFRNTLIFSFLGLALAPLPMILAIVLSEFKFSRYQKFIQSTTTFPYFISMIVIYSFCLALFSVDDGIVNNFLLKIGLITERQNYLTDEGIVYIFQTFISQWRIVGFNAIIYYAAISGIDPELYDAAAVDGASTFHRMWYIKVPGLLPTFLVLTLISVGHMLNNGFEQFFVFHNAAVHDRIQVLDLYIYKIGMERGNYSLSTAIGMLKTLVSLTLLFSVNFISKRAVGRSII